MVTIAIGSALDTVSTRIESIEILGQKLQAKCNFRSIALNRFSESPLFFLFQYLYHCSIIEHCTVNKVCIEFPKKSRAEH